MYNDLFSIGPVTIHGYGLMIGIGVMVALLLSEKRAKNRGLNPDHIYTLVFLAVVLGFVAARVLFIITEWRDFLSNPKAYLTGAGFVVYGGIIGGIITIVAYCAIKRISAFDYLDLLVAGVAFAQAFGRVGCFLAGCCYGRETTCPIGVTFSHSDFAPNGVSLLPTQLFMAVGDLALGLILIWYGRRKHIRCQETMLYLTLYSIGRFVVEFFRADDRGNVGALSTSQFIGIIMFVIAGTIFVLLERRRRLKMAD